MIKVYIKINNNNEIISINSSIFLNDINDWIKIDEGKGDKYAHAQSNYLFKPLVDELGRYNFKFIDDTIVEIPNEEKISSSTEPSQLDILEAQVTYTAMMTNTLLEV